MNIEKTIANYDALRVACYEAWHAGKATGKDSSQESVDFFQRIVSASDIDMEGSSSGILCWGSTWSNRTQDTEHFEFTIPFSALEQ